MRGVTVSSALAAMLVMSVVPAEADACTGIERPSPGLSLTGMETERTIAADGVLVFDAFARQTTPEAAVKAFALTMTFGGVAVPGTLEVVPLWSGILEYAGGVEEGALPLHEFLIVWRPDAVLQPGTYVGLVEQTPEGGVVEHIDLTITVSGAVGPAIAAPEVERVVAQEFIAEVHEQACCERTPGSCGDAPYCRPTAVRYETGLAIDAALAEAQRERAYLWVAPVENGEVGTGLPAHGDYSYGAYQSNWALWPVGELLRLDGSGERCVVLGATSLIDGSTAMSEPRCAEIAAPREATLMPEFLPADLEGSGMGECLSPPVYEHSGEPYLPYDGGETTVEQGGCRVAGQGPWGLLVLGLVWRRRARRG